MTGFGGEIGEGESGAYRRGGTCNRQTPQRLTGTWVQANVAKGGAHPHGKRRQTQVPGAGRREEWRRLAVGGFGRRPGEHRFAPGEELGSG